MKLLKKKRQGKMSPGVVLLVSAKEFAVLRSRWMMGHSAFRELSDADKRLLQTEMEICVTAGRQYENPQASADDDQGDRVETYVALEYLTEEERIALGVYEANKNWACWANYSPYGLGPWKRTSEPIADPDLERAVTAVVAIGTLDGPHRAERLRRAVEKLVETVFAAAGVDRGRVDRLRAWGLELEGRPVEKIYTDMARAHLRPGDLDDADEGRT